ncbi:hypothetical protein MLD52_22715, partial [Puniceicoccaceae bacterium K14]|nr:hypothetical protein [Puniceicoccaceae bacterium K14]
ATTFMILMICFGPANRSDQSSKIRRRLASRLRSDSMTGGTTGRIDAALTGGVLTMLGSQEAGYISQLWRTTYST